MILTKNNISYFIINYILLKKNNYKILLEIQDDYIEPKLTNIFKHVKSKDILGKDFEIELYGIEHNKAELVNNILKIENNYEARYLKDYLLTTQREKVLNEISTLITKDVSIEEKKVLIEKSLKNIDGFKDSTLSDSNSCISRYKEYITEMSDLYKNKDGLIGISTGVDRLDYKIRGVKNQDFVVVGARPSMGKTSFVLNMFLNAIRTNEVPVMFSLEMPKEQILGRGITQLNNALNMNQTMYGEGYEETKSSIDDILNYLSEKDFYIEDFKEDAKAKITVNDLRVRAGEIENKLKAVNKKIGIIIIDYLQLISPDSRGSMSTNDIMSEISKGCKALGKIFSCPIVALSQLNRQLESRTDKRPQMSDLRDSGAIEQDADIIMFLYRPSVYLSKEIREQMKKRPNDDHLIRELEILEQQKIDDAEIIIGKQRNGEIGIVPAAFLKQSAMYGDREKFEDEDIWG